MNIVSWKVSRFESLRPGNERVLKELKLYFMGTMTLTSFPPIFYEKGGRKIHNHHL